MPVGLDKVSLEATTSSFEVRLSMGCLHYLPPTAGNVPLPPHSKQAMVTHPTAWELLRAPQSPCREVEEGEQQQGT